MSDGLAELRQFAASIERVTEGAYDEVDAVIFKGAMNMKREMVADIKKSKHFVGKKGPGFESSITFEEHNTKDVIRRELGPDKSRPGGALGNIYYFGTSRGGGSGDIEKPINSEAPRLIGAIQKLVEKWAGQL